ASSQLPAMAMLAGRALNFLAANVADFADFMIRMTDKLSSNKSLSDDDRAVLESKRLTQFGYGPGEQSVQSYQQPYILSGGMGTGYHTHQKVIPAGPRYNEIQSLIDRMDKMSGTAIQDPVFTKYLLRDKLGFGLEDIAGHGPAGFGDVQLPPGVQYGNPLAA